MKKFKIIFALTAIICLFSATPSQADLYIGADFTRSHFSYQDENEPYLSDNYNIAGPVIGFSINGVGVEGFYKVSNEMGNDDDFDSKLKSYGADFVVALPTNEYLDVVGSVGYIKNELSYELNGKEINVDTDGLRFGLGFQFNLNRVVSLRTMYHYTALSKDLGRLDAINEISAGIRLNF